jgi:mRNA-degrading endonuclease YafQ of YafQ-DinJ toxin-antitoxin module
MPKLIFTDSYEKRAKKFLKQHPELKDQYAKTLKLLSVNPSHPSLRLHRLQGKLSILHSVSINYSYRITLQFIVKNDQIIPIDIGKHDKVY